MYVCNNLLPIISITFKRISPPPFTAVKSVGYKTITFPNLRLKRQISVGVFTKKTSFIPLLWDYKGQDDT